MIIPRISNSEQIDNLCAIIKDEGASFVVDKFWREVPRKNESLWIAYSLGGSEDAAGELLSILRGYASSLPNDLLESIESRREQANIHFEVSSAMDMEPVEEAEYWNLIESSEAGWVQDEKMSMFFNEY